MREPGTSGPERLNRLQELIGLRGIEPAEFSAAWKVGDLVRVRGRSWRIAKVRTFSDCTLLDLTGAGWANVGRDLEILTPFDRPTRLLHSNRPEVVQRRRAMHALRGMVSQLATDFELRTAAAARIELLPYQLEPALAIVTGTRSRVLIADEVGLGKTIQAGLIVAELRARSLADRVLIVTPASLREQWASELGGRFYLPCEVVDGPGLARLVARLPQGRNPWTMGGVRIVSADFLKRPETLRPIAEVLWDLLLIDEAHGVSQSSDRAAAVQEIACRTRRVVLLTATPHAGDDATFARLCNIGRLEPDAPVLLFRRGRDDAECELTRRRVTIYRIRPTDAEGRMHHMLQAYVRRVWREAGPRHDSSARLAMIVLSKRAFSSASSLRRSIDRRLACLAGGPLVEHQPGLPFLEDDEELGDCVLDTSLAAPGLEDPVAEREWLERLQRLAADASAAESKVIFLSRLVRRTQETLLVFTEYRDTLVRVCSALESLTTVASLHGGLTTAERREVCRRFVEGEVRVLVATDAASEGLNLQARCRFVINLELPWNPVRLEQRIGRVDRIGQIRTVHAAHLLARGTPESAVLGRLVRRWQRARVSLADLPDPIGRPTEDEVAAAMIDWVSNPFPRLSGRSGLGVTVPVTSVFRSSPSELRESARREVRRLVGVRRLQRQGPDRGLTTREAGSKTSDGLPEIVGPLITTLRKRTDGVIRPGMVAAYRAIVTDGSGQLLEEALVSVECRLADRAFPARRRDLKEWLARRLATIEPDLKQVGLTTLTDRANDLRHRLVERLRVSMGRERAIGDRASRTRPAEPMQIGLFDRRALRHLAQIDDLVKADLRESSERLAAGRLALERPLTIELALFLVLLARAR